MSLFQWIVLWTIRRQAGQAVATAVSARLPRLHHRRGAGRQRHGERGGAAGRHGEDEGDRAEAGGGDRQTEVRRLAARRRQPGGSKLTSISRLRPVRLCVPFTCTGHRCYCTAQQTESGTMMGQRLYDIEFELEEQKRSTTKITKLCMAAIKALEKIEQKPVLIDTSVEECKDMDNNAVDPEVIKTLCMQMEALNKLLIKVDDDIEAVDQKAEDSLSDCEKANERLNALEKSQKDRCDSLLGEMKALLVSKTYATREDLSRSIKTIPIGLSKEEIAEMIRDSQTQLNLKIDMIPTPLQKNEVAQMIERWQKKTYLFRRLSELTIFR